MWCSTELEEKWWACRNRMSDWFKWEQLNKWWAVLVIGWGEKKKSWDLTEFNDSRKKRTNADKKFLQVEVIGTRSTGSEFRRYFLDSEARLIRGDCIKLLRNSFVHKLREESEQNERRTEPSQSQLKSSIHKTSSLLTESGWKKFLIIQLWRPSLVENSKYAKSVYGSGRLVHCVNYFSSWLFRVIDGQIKPRLQRIGTHCATYDGSEIRKFVWNCCQVTGPTRPTPARKKSARWGGKKALDRPTLLRIFFLGLYLIYFTWVILNKLHFCSSGLPSSLFHFPYQHSA